MSDLALADAIKTAARTIADASRDQKPRVVVVPMVFGGTRDWTAEELKAMADVMKHAFEEALK